MEVTPRDEIICSTLTNNLEKPLVGDLIRRSTVQALKNKGSSLDGPNLGPNPTANPKLELLPLIFFVVSGMSTLSIYFIMLAQADDFSLLFPKMNYCFEVIIP